MASARMRIGELLVHAGILGEEELRTALAEQRRVREPLGRILVAAGMVPEETLLFALSAQLGVEVVPVDELPIAPAVLALVKPEQAVRWSMIPFRLEGSQLDVAFADPTASEPVDELQIRTRLAVRPFLASPSAMVRALARHYGEAASGMGPPIDEEQSRLQARVEELEKFVERQEEALRQFGELCDRLGVSLPDDLAVWAG